MPNSIFEIGIGSLGNPFNALTVLNDGKVGIGTTVPDALLTVQGGIRPIMSGGNLCANTTDYPRGTMFYNSADDYYCFCNGTGASVKMSDETASCF